MNDCAMHQNRSHKMKRRNGMKIREPSAMPHCLKSTSSYKEPDPTLRDKQSSDTICDTI